MSVTKITHTTEANLGKVTLQASASDLTAEEKASGKTLHDKKAITIDAASRVKAHDNNALSTGAAVGAAHVKETLDVKATTQASRPARQRRRMRKTRPGKEKRKPPRMMARTRAVRSPSAQEMMRISTARR